MNFAATRLIIGTLSAANLFAANLFAANLYATKLSATNFRLRSLPGLFPKETANEAAFRL
jgi:uncharacterized protein YjbI with pentapeptide repeats